MRRRDKQHLAWVKTLVCAHCFNDDAIEAHHPKGHIFGTGMGMKSHDDLAVPLCSLCHRMYHDGNIKDAHKLQKHWVLDTLIEALEQGRLVICHE